MTILKIRYMACALSSAVDKETNQVSLFHVLEEITAGAYPTKLASFCVVSLFEHQAGDALLENYVVSIQLDGALLFSVASQVDFSKSRLFRRIATIKDLAIPAPGVFEVSILRKSDVLATWRALAQRSGKAPQRRKPEPPTIQGETTPAQQKRRMN